MDETHFPLLRWCIRQYASLDYATAERIGASGNMSLIEEFLGEYGCNELVSLFGGAARSGSAAAALTLYSRLDVDDVGFLDARKMKQDVSAGGLVEIAQLIDDTPSIWECLEMAPALVKGHLRFVQWARSGSTLDPLYGGFAVTDAAISGSVDLMQWLLDEKGLLMTDGAVCSTAKAGMLASCRWLHGQRGSDLQPAVATAARHGQLHVLEWLIEQGCPVDEEVVHEAAHAPTSATIAWLLDRCYLYDEGHRRRPQAPG